MTKALIIAEHDHHQIKAATLSCIAAAKQVTDDITVWVLGQNIEKIAQSVACVSGVTQVFKSESDLLASFLAEILVAQIMHRAAAFTHIMAPATTFGKNILPRLAALLDCDMLSDVIAIQSADTFVRPIYAGNALETVQSTARIHLMTIRPSHFKVPGSQAAANVATIPLEAAAHRSRFIQLQATKSERPELSSARVVVSGGRGLQSAENFKLLDHLAEKLNAAVGASRAAVDAEYVPNDYQVGQTGKIVAPDLYIAIGISGAIQHIAGMKDSKCIVAINKDPDAPIFQVADYGLVGDLFELVPKLIALL